MPRGVCRSRREIRNAFSDGRQVLRNFLTTGCYDFHNRGRAPKISGRVVRKETVADPTDFPIVSHFSIRPLI